MGYKYNGLEKKVLNPLAAELFKADPRSSYPFFLDTQGSLVLGPPSYSDLEVEASEK